MLVPLLRVRPALGTLLAGVRSLFYLRSTTACVFEVNQSDRNFMKCTASVGTCDMYVNHGLLDSDLSCSIKGCLF